MWILVIGDWNDVGRSDGPVAVLADLGADIQTAPIETPWPLEAHLRAEPPAAVLIEALHDFNAARGALDRLRAERRLAQTPMIAAVPVGSLQRLDGADGFDDFVLVPYIAAELYVRIRRSDWRRGEFVAPERIKIGPVWIDLATHEVVLDGRPVEMTRREFELLRFLCQNRGRVISREELLRSVWGVQGATSRTVDMHMRNLRLKLRGQIPLETRRGVGYMLRAA
jgi:two-component system alkaline phosphatase synthesis response regulator PhoP